MTRKEYVEFYKEELEKLEKHKEGLLEVDKNTRYTDKKINHIYDLLVILENCNKSEMLREENIGYKRIIWKIENCLENIEKLKLHNNREEIKKEISKLLEFLKETVEDENEK